MVLVNWEVWTNGYLIGHYETDERLEPHDIIKLNNRPYKIEFVDKKALELDVFSII
jgi:hypothetical protein